MEKNSEKKNFVPKIRNKEKISTFPTLIKYTEIWLMKFKFFQKVEYMS